MKAEPSFYKPFPEAPPLQAACIRECISYVSLFCETKYLREKKSKGRWLYCQPGLRNTVHGSREAWREQKAGTQLHCICGQAADRHKCCCVLCSSFSSFLLLLRQEWDYIAHSSHKLMILLCQSPTCWNYRYVQLLPVTGGSFAHLDGSRGWDKKAGLWKTIFSFSV